MLMIMIMIMIHANSSNSSIFMQISTIFCNDSILILFDMKIRTESVRFSRQIIFLFLLLSPIFYCEFFARG